MAMPRMSQFFDGPGADDLGEERDADAHDVAGLAALERRALRRLLLAQLGVFRALHRLLHGGVIVAGIVFPAQRRVIRELLRLDEVLQPQLRRIHAELLRQDVHPSLDAIGGLGDAERAAIGDAAGRLVGVDAVDREMRDREVVGSGDDVEEAGRPFRRVGAGIERAVIGEHMDAKARDLAVLGRGDLGRHVVVARERGRGQVLDAVLDPFHRLAGDDGGDRRADVAGIGADLVAEAAADVGRDHVDLVLRQFGDQRHHGADHVRRLEGAPDRQLAPDLVEGADALAGLQRRRMDAVIGDQLLDRHLGLPEGRVGQVLVADGPLEDVVVVLARAVRARRLAGEVLAQHRRILVHRLEGVDQPQAAARIRPRPC